MKTQTSNAILFVALVFSLLAASCATQPKVNWDARIGHYTYDQAVLELGPPDRQAELGCGGKVAEWVVARSVGGSVSIGFGTFGAPTGVGVTETVGSGGRNHVLRLTFGDDGYLTAWQRN